MDWFDGGDLSFDTWNDPSFSNYAPIEFQPPEPPPAWTDQFQMGGSNMFGGGSFIPNAPLTGASGGAFPNVGINQQFPIAPMGGGSFIPNAPLTGASGGAFPNVGINQQFPIAPMGGGGLPPEEQFRLGGGNMFGEGNSSGGGGLQFMPGSLGAPGAATPTGGQGGPPSLLQQLIGGGLGAAPGVASLIAALSQGNKQTYQGQQNPQQRAQLNQMAPGAQTLFNSGAGLLGQLGAGTNPLQTQQNSILGALAPQAANLASGNVQIPEQLRTLVKQAYDPYVGDIASQAIESARNRGFSGGAELLNTGPAGAIAGPALSNAAGMQANSLLQAMLAFPQASANISGAYNQPVNQLANVAGASIQPAFNVANGYGNGGNGYQISGTGGTQAAGAAGQALAGGLQGAAQPGQQYQNQQNFDKLLAAFNKQQGNPQMPGAGGMYS